MSNVRRYTQRRCKLGEEVLDIKEPRKNVKAIGSRYPGINDKKDRIYTYIGASGRRVPHQQKTYKKGPDDKICGVAFNLDFDVEQLSKGS